MKYIIALIIILTLITIACNTDNGTGGFGEKEDQVISERVVCRSRAPMCTQEYDPVLGSDGAEYSNGCTACSHEEVDWFEKLN